MSRKRRPKTKDLEKEDTLENEDLENEDPLENENPLENEDPLEKHAKTKQKIEAESSLAYLQISKMAETWSGVLLASLQVPVLFSDKRAQNKQKHHRTCYLLPRKTTRQQQKRETRYVENTRVRRTNDTATGSFFFGSSRANFRSGIIFHFGG